MKSIISFEKDNTSAEMKEDQDSIDLRLDLGKSAQWVQTRLKNKKGAGVNAGSGVDMAFTASDPLSELVWSPHNGLSLRCADSSLADKRPFLLWNVGPKNLVLSPPESIRARGDDAKRPTSDGNFCVAQMASHMHKNLAGETGWGSPLPSKASPAFANSRNQIESTGEEKMNIAGKLNGVHDHKYVKYHHGHDGHNMPISSVPTRTAFSDYDAGRYDQKNSNFLACGTSDSGFGLALTQPLVKKLNEMISKSCSGRIENVAGGNQSSSLGISRASEVHEKKECDGPSLFPSLSRQRGAEAATLVNEQETENKVSRHCLVSVEKLESTAENDLLHLVQAGALEQSDIKLSRENSVALEASPTDSRMELYKKKGKGKVLSDGDANVVVRLPNEEEDSAESCNSAGLSAKSRKRTNREGPMVDGKRAKIQAEDCSAFTSPVTHNSSFMNWISNMVKGYRESPLPLTLSQSGCQRENYQQDIICCNKNLDAGCSNMGFNAVFQSLYCPTIKKLETRVSEIECSEEQSKQLMLANSQSFEIPLIACPSEKDQSCEKSEENIRAMTSQNLVLSSDPQVVMPVNAAPIQEAYETSSRENKDDVSLVGSLSKQRNSTPEYSSPHPLSEFKSTYNESEGNNNLGSLWITRFSSKSTCMSLQMDQSNQHKKRGIANSDHARFNNGHHINEIPHKRKTLGTMENSSERAGDDILNDLKGVPKYMEESAAYEEVVENNHQMSIHSLTNILPSAKFQSSEAMASIFARRLDALKHISPSDKKIGMPPHMTTCLFCGKQGHELLHCSDPTESELEELLLNASSYKMVEGSCLCIRCFQIDHWANECPLRSSRRKQILEKQEFSSDLNIQMGEGKGKYSSLLKKGAGHFLNSANLIICSREEPLVCAESDSLMWSAKENYGKEILYIHEVKKCSASRFGQQTSKHIQIPPMCNFVGKQKVKDLPKGMFDAIRRLRLSRVDIIRSMNSHVPSSHLNGFFLRLRMGKLEAGLGETGYYVASIFGDQNESSAKDSKNSILVNVGGIQSLVGIQYVSNHDFLEDELVAWWCRTLERGAKVPSEDELRSKFEERSQLGFC